MHQQDPPDSFGSLDVTELFCARCQRSQPVRKHLLLVLPNGNQFDLRCAVCGESVGHKTDNDQQTFADTLKLS